MARWSDVMSCQGQPLPGHFLHGHWLSGCEEWRAKLAGYLHWRGRWDATKPQFYGSRLVTIIGAMKEIAACAVRTMGFGTPTQLGFKAPNESKWIQNDATWNWQEKFSAQAQLAARRFPSTGVWRSLPLRPTTWDLLACLRDCHLVTQRPWLEELEMIGPIIFDDLTGPTSA